MYNECYYTVITINIGATLLNDTINVQLFRDTAAPSKIILKR